MTDELKDKEEILENEENTAAAATTEDGCAAGDFVATEPAEPAEPAEAAAELTPEQLLAQAKAEIEELKTQALYKQAEFENYRKRTIKEKAELIYQKFLKALAGLGVKPIDTEGKDFDVDLHEAVAQVPGVPDEQKGRVIDCIEKGYMLNDQVIRHAKVAVGM